MVDTRKHVVKTFEDERRDYVKREAAAASQIHRASKEKNKSVVQIVKETRVADKCDHIFVYRKIGKSYKMMCANCGTYQNNK